MGRDAVFGSFPLTVPGEDHLTVHMEEGEGDVPVTPLTQEEFNQGPAAYPPPLPGHTLKV